MNRFKKCLIVLASLGCSSMAMMAGQSLVTTPQTQLRQVPQLVGNILQPAVPPDPCAPYASPATTTTFSRRTDFIPTYALPNAPGPGPMPDVTGWFPAAGVQAGGELIIKGRNLATAGFVAQIAGRGLTATSASPSEIRFQVPADLRSAGAPLVVYQQNGQARTLTQSYVVFDASPRINGVVPANFESGDVVTVCGSSLNLVFTGAKLAGFDPPKDQIQIAWIGRSPLQIYQPVASPSGDRLTFIAGDSLKFAYGAPTAPTLWQLQSYPLAAAVPPAPMSGPLQLTKPRPGDIAGPGVSWQPGAPKFRSVVSRGYPDQPLVVILPTNNSYNAQNWLMSSLKIVGGNLNGTYRIGNLPISSANLPVEDGTEIWINVPMNATSGPLCGSKNGKTTCTNTIPVLGGPVFTQTPPSFALKLNTTYTLRGLNLQPAGIPGLRYNFVAGGFSTGDPRLTACNIEFQLLTYTAQEITFRFGDPSRTANPAPCLTRALTTPSSTPGVNYPLMLSALYNGVPPQTLWAQPFTLTP